MKNIVKKVYVRFRHLIWYGIIGGCSASLDFMIYSILVRVCSWHYLVANCFSILAGITTSFILNRSYNFKVKDKAWRRFALFLSVGLTGLLVSNAILFVLIYCLKLGTLWAKFLSTGAVVLFQFVLNRFVTFKE